MNRINRHWYTLVLAAGMFSFDMPAHAQTVGYNIRTGDVWVDTRLGEINTYGRQFRDPFVDELARHYGAPRSLLVELLDRRRWAPADVYFACAIAHALGRPCVEIVREYDRNPREGWGALAKRMGIKPGSPAFHALKRGTVDTYDRWGRPVAVDRDVRIDWSTAPGKGHAHARTGPEGRAAHERPPGKGHGRDGHHGKDVHPGKGKGKTKD